MDDMTYEDGLADGRRELEVEVERLREALDTAVAEMRAGTRDSMMYALRNLYPDVMAGVEARLRVRDAS